MHLLAPWGLAWLGLAVPILLLYLLRLRRREVTVASVLFWEQATEDLQANAPFQRLRRNLLLYLQLLALTLVALAASRPFVRTDDLGGAVVIAILDGSASMTAPYGGATRFAAARDGVARLIDGLTAGDELMIVLATDRAEVLCPLTDDRRALARALAGARPQSCPTDLRDALYLAGSIARSREEARIYVFSDGACPPLEAIGVGLGAARLVRCGTPVDNVGITALDARRSYGEANGHEVLLALSATGPSPAERRVEVEFRADGRLFDVRTYAVTPGRPFVTILSDLPVASGLLELRLTGRDGLAADDVAFVSLGAPRRTEVWLAGRSCLFLDRALAIDPTLRVIRTTAGGVAQAHDEGRFPTGGVAVFYGEAPARELDLPALYVHAAAPGSPLVAAGVSDSPTITDWSREHPVTRHVDFGEVAVATALDARLAPWATALVEAGQTPLVAVGERHGTRRVAVGFDFVDSDFPLRAGFPIFIANALAWLNGGVGRDPTPAVRAGEPLTLRLAGDATRAEVTRPDGSRFVVPVENGRATVGDTRQVGFYTLRAGPEVRTFAVSLLSPEETDLTPRTQLRVGRGVLGAPERDNQRNREYWRWLVVLALGVLTVEWWWYHRRG